jgi:uncharacterized protein YutE (UPF0331/DUF86 family)
MVRPEVAGQKIARASARLEQAEAILSRPREEFASDPQARDLASFHLLLAIQEVIDLAAHWVADAGWPAPADASSAFEVLADHGVIERGLAEGLRGAAGLRNRIAHGYAGLDHGRLHDESRAGVATLRRFLVRVAEAGGL